MPDRRAIVCARLRMPLLWLATALIVVTAVVDRWLTSPFGLVLGVEATGPHGHRTLEDLRGSLGSRAGSRSGPQGVLESGGGVDGPVGTA